MPCASFWPATPIAVGDTSSVRAISRTARLVVMPTFSIQA